MLCLLTVAVRAAGVGVGVAYVAMMEGREEGQVGRGGRSEVHGEEWTERRLADENKKKCWGGRDERRVGRERRIGR